jgi:hypothetical protein
VAEFLDGVERPVCRNGLPPGAAGVTGWAGSLSLVTRKDTERKGASRIQADELQTVVPSVGLGKAVGEAERVR